MFLKKTGGHNCLEENYDKPINYRITKSFHPHENQLYEESEI